MDEGVIFPGQRPSKGKEKKEGGFSVYSTKSESGVSNRGQLRLLLLNSIYPVCAQDQCQVEPLLAVRCVLKALCLLVSQLCQWSGALGESLPTGLKSCFLTMMFPRHPVTRCQTGTNRSLCTWGSGKACVTC